MKRIIVLAAITAVVLSLAAFPALAEGYNDPLEYTRATGYASGPHGGYTSTTNKCQDCHSTHYASGSYVLLRANSREAACDFCHVGGGGSQLNIQMDNDYQGVGGGVEATTTMGYGTGHTLGYTGNAPVDINPAYSQSQGFACFNCHTPHGNSARVLTTFANPGRAFQPTNSVVTPFLSGGADGTVAFLAAGGTMDGSLYNLGSLGVGDGVFWGLTSIEGNIVLSKDVAGVRKNMKKPIWPTGRFLLLKNPHSDAAENGQSDTTTGSAPGSGGQLGYNKLAIDWDEPLGPADGAYGGVQDRDYNKGMPWNPAGVTGLLSVSEFCTDCHDGAAGASTQQATVWYSDDHNSAPGAYAVAYSHDSQPRH